MLHRERKQVVLEQLQNFTWRVQKQKNWCGGYEYMIEVVELDGLISYGDTYKEAKEGLVDSVFYWLKHRKLRQLPEGESRLTHLVHICTTMTEDEFAQINLLVREW